LHLIIIARKLILPILKKRGAVFISKEANTFISLFESVNDAKNAALEIINAFKETIVEL
jgi:hypothetical protein